VNQARGAEGVPRPLTSKLGVRQTSKLLVDKRNELIHGLGVAVSQLEEQVSHLAGVAGLGRRELSHERGILARCGLAGKPSALNQDAGSGRNWQQRTTPGPSRFERALQIQMSLFAWNRRV
jgi:hypothetical protein